MYLHRGDGHGLQRIQQCHAGVGVRRRVEDDALHAIETANSAGFFTFGVYEPTAAADWQRIREISGGWGMELTELLQYFI